MTERRAIDLVVERLRNSLLSGVPDAVLAMAIGGSFARHSQNTQSDLDVFVLIEGRGTGAIKAHYAEICSWLMPGALSRGPYTLPHWGHTVTIVAQDLTVLQIHFNTLDTLEINPMRASSEIVYDPSGQYAHFVAEAAQMQPDLIRVVRDSLLLIWTRALFCHNALLSGEIWRAHAYLTDIRLCIMRIRRVHSSRFRAGVEFELPASKYEADMGIAEATSLQYLAPGYDPQEIRTALSICVRDLASELTEGSLTRFLSSEELGMALQIAAAVVIPLS